jgi:serine protease AprX
MAADNLYAEVVLRSRTGASILREAGRITPQRLDLFQANEGVASEATEAFERAGFRVLARSRFGISIVGPKNLFEQYFKTRVVERSGRTLVGDAQAPARARVMEVPPAAPENLAAMIESVYIPQTGSFHAGEGAMPRPAYYSLSPPDDIVTRLNAAGAHSRGFGGHGVRVAMIDSGFIANHEYYRERKYQITVHAVVGQVDQDEYGHGTGVAANLLAIAPSCDFHLFKMTTTPQENLWATIAAFRQAVDAGARVITSSWKQDPDAMLETEIVSAVAAGITVVFSAGNLGRVSWPGCLPQVLSIGGAFPRQDGTWEASSFASSGTHPAFPDRHVPDLVAISGQAPKSILIVMPTMRDSLADHSHSEGGAFPNGDETGPSDGWLVSSGTSSATPMVAAAAALLLQARPSLTPAEVRQVFCETCRDITQGASASGETAGVGPDFATGAGLLDVTAAVDRVVATRPVVA